MSSDEDQNADDALPFDVDEVMTAKRDNPGMFVSSWQADENDIDGWSKAELAADPIKQFMVAAENGKLNTIEDLLSRAHKHSSCNNDICAISSDAPVFPSLSELLSFQDKDGYTPLHRAAYGGHTAVLKRLINAGANLNARTHDGWTPLHSAAFWNQLGCVQSLILSGAQTDAVTNSNQTPLHLCMSNKQSPETLYLLLSQPDPPVYRLPNKQGDTVADLLNRSTPYYRDVCYAFSMAATNLGNKHPHVLEN